MYADRMVKEVLAAALPGKTVRTEWSADYANNLPFIAVSGTASGDIPDFRAGGRASQSVDLDVFSGVDKADASAIAWQALTAIDAAWRNQTATTAGHIAGRTVTIMPFVVPTQGLPASVTRISCTVIIRMRP